MFTKIGVKSERMDVIISSNVMFTKIGVKSKRMDVIVII